MFKAMVLDSSLGREDILGEENDTESAMMTFLGKEQFHVDVLYHVVSLEVGSP